MLYKPVPISDRIQTVQEVFKSSSLNEKPIPVLEGDPCRRIVFCQAANLFLTKSKVLRRLFYCQGIPTLNRDMVSIDIHV